MTRWLLVITWVAMIFYHLGFKNNDQKPQPEPIGYYEIDYLHGDIKAVWVDITNKTSKDVSIEEIENNSGLKFPKYKGANEKY